MVYYRLWKEVNESKYICKYKKSATQFLKAKNIASKMNAWIKEFFLTLSCPAQYAMYNLVCLHKAV